MDFKFTPSEEAFRKEVRQWLKEKANPSLDEDMKFFFLGRVHPEMPDSVREFTCEVGKKGWLGMNWPKKYGGQERSIIEQLIVIEELEYNLMGLYNFEALTMMGPTVLERGSEALKMTYLPRIASGEIEMALGYTEPQAGSDLASLELRAEKSYGYYILNGQKTFNSVGHYADAFYCTI